MSLLDRGKEDILIFQEEEWTDRDGNTMLRPSEVGTPARAVIQPAAQSGTSARRKEQDNEGYETEDVYRLRLPRSFPFLLGSQAQIEWRGARWCVVGNPMVFSGSKRTAHVDYTIRRT
jgi:hypothetical protein